MNLSVRAEEGRSGEAPCERECEEEDASRKNERKDVPKRHTVWS